MPLLPSSAKASLPAFWRVETTRSGSGAGRWALAGTVLSTAAKGPTIIATR